MMKDIPDYVMQAAIEMAEDIRRNLTQQEKELFIFDRLVDESVYELMGEVE